MVKYAFVAFVGLAAALPLNINLGAYSPALVVGDGEISFGGRQDVSNLISALEGAAVNAAAGAANVAAASTTNAAAAGTANTGAAAAGPAAASASTLSLPDTVENAAVDPALAGQAQQIAGLQGLGKAIAPRVDTVEAAEKLGKRDLAGFDRALTFAEAALTKGPKIQLGTGAEGSGVGIIVDHNAAAGAEGAAAAKRDLDNTGNLKRRAKVTTMYVRRGVPASLQGSSEGAIAAEAVAARAPPAPVPVSRRDAIDAVNLNVDGDAGVTMTFVESFDDDEDDE